MHTMTGYSAGQLAFRRNMLMQCRVTADWESIKQNWIASSRKTLERESVLGIAHKYCVSNRVLLVLSSKEVTRKIDAPTTGPFQVTAVLRNGTVKIRQDS